MKNPLSLPRLALTIAIPLALQNLITFAVSMVDTVMLGQLGDVVLSAAAQANQLFAIVMLTVAGIVGGANILIAQAWGKHDIEAIHRVLAYTYRCALLFALCVTALAVGIPNTVMRLFSSDVRVVALGTRYLRVVGCSYLLFALTMVTSGALQAVRTVRVSMVAAAVAMVVKIGLNWMLVFGGLGVTPMGVLGAGIATLIARFCEFLIVVLYAAVWDKKLCIRIKKLLPLDKAVVRTYFGISLPVIANELFWALGDAALAVLMGRIGTEMVSANSICVVVVQVTGVFCNGIAAAACIIVANTVGSGQTADLKEQKRFFQRLSVALGLGAAVFVFAVRPLALSIYNVQAATLVYANQILLVEAGLQVFRYFQLMNMMGLLRGGGDVRFAMLNDLVFLWGFTVPAGFVAGLVLHWPVAAVYLVIKLDQVIKAFTSEGRLRGGRWLHDTTCSNEGECHAPT